MDNAIGGLMRIITFTLGMLIIWLLGTGALLVTGKSPSRLLIGDSIAAAWSLPDTVNGGIGGSTSDDVLYTWRLKYRDSNWQTVIVLVGTNDIGAGLSFEGYRDNIRQLLWGTQHRGTRLILCSILPAGPDKQNGRPNDQIKAWNAWLREFATDNGITYLDFYSAMIDGKVIRADLTSDGLHPSALGYSLMNEILKRA